MTTGLRFYPASHRYKLDGEWVPSVTGISKTGGGCEGLVKWAGEVTAAYAVDHIELAEQLDREAYVQLVSTEARRARDRASSAGVEVHRIAQHLIADEPVEVEPYLMPYAEQARDLIERYDLMALFNESLVGSRQHQYAGRLDTIARLVTAERGEHLALIDWKTGKSFWTDVALQLVGYARADFAVVGNHEEPVPPVDAHYIAHIGPDSAELYPVHVDDETWQTFLAARRLQPFTKLRRDTVIGDALDHPARELVSGDEW